MTAEPQLNWMQDYAAREMVELGDEGRISRREMVTRLVAICGSLGAANAFLAACSSSPSAGTGPASTAGGGTSNAGTSPASGGSTTATSGASAAQLATTPITEGGAGHALAVAADDPDVLAGPVTFPGPEATMLGYLAQPSEGGKRPGILVIHEIFGLTDHIRDVARRLAKAGYLALAVDLASRAGGTDATDNVMGALTGGPIEERIADLEAGVSFLEEQQSYDGKLGVIGFCFGGGMTLSMAAAEPKVLAAVPYYGPTPQPASDLQKTNAAILAHYGETDARVNGSIPDLEAALAGKTFEKQVHPGVGHAFNNDTGGAYSEKEAITAWGQTLGWLARYLS